MSRQPFPKYGLHKSTGQARVKILGKTYYLGKYGTPESREKYARLIAAHAQGEAVAPEPKGCRPAITTRTVLFAYLEHAGNYYRKGGKVTDQLCVISRLPPRAGPPRRHGGVVVRPEGLEGVSGRHDQPGLVQELREQGDGLRGPGVGVAVTEELVPGEAAESLREAPALRVGEGGVRESEPRGPVPPGDFEKVLPHLPAEVADLLRVQFWPACGPWRRAT